MLLKTHTAGRSLSTYAPAISTGTTKPEETKGPCWGQGESTERTVNKEGRKEEIQLNQPKAKF